MSTTSWIARVPPPSAKRYEGSGRVFLHVEDGWGYAYDRELRCRPVISLHLDSEIEWEGDATTVDGMRFSLCVKYENSTGSRGETIPLTPTKVPTSGSLWKHLKTGTIYKVVSVCKMEADLTVGVLYKKADETELPWCRPLAEFMDGRFQQENT